ncbi:MAG: polyprenyl synthetase family protein [Phycisphaerae bacterium]|nr:polyprenyl synthetase family protein [Phycisphaerae bacterium]
MMRCVDPRVPADRDERQRLFALAQNYVADNSLRGPLSFTELAAYADGLVGAASLDAAVRDYLAILIHNEVWRPLVAAVPMDRRLLLLPQCFRDPSRCTAAMDELGLQCHRCGGCVTGEIVATAERLGYLVLVAEGTAVVMSLIEAGRVEAIVGVSCTDVLEKVFPYVASAAVPSVAVPLVRKGCEQTATDWDWLYEFLTLQGPDRGQRMNVDALRNDVASWFERAALDELLAGGDGGDGPAHELSLDWLAQSGKRWRPFLAACTHQALQDDPTGAIPDDFRHVAVAVECFHKASLIHDDIEDQDAFRYGQPTLHARHGVPIALNVGDMLLGMGYRMIASCGLSGSAKADMLQVASDGHCQLCAGQGAELAWMANPVPLSVGEVLDIFRRKTAPAFDVALSLGAIYAGAGGATRRILNGFSQSLGIAYQIYDDLDDFAGGGDGLGDAAAMRPGILLAIAHERTSSADRALLEALWRREASMAENLQAVTNIFRVQNVEEHARELMEQHKGRAMASLVALDGPRGDAMRVLLSRVTARIFGRDVSAMSCCHEKRNPDATVARASRP